MFLHQHKNFILEHPAQLPRLSFLLLVFCVSLDSFVYQAVSTDFCAALVLLSILFEHLYSQIDVAGTGQLVTFLMDSSCFLYK